MCVSADCCACRLYAPAGEGKGARDASRTATLALQHYIRHRALLPIAHGPVFVTAQTYGMSAASQRAPSPPPHLPCLFDAHCHLQASRPASTHALSGLCTCSRSGDRAALPRCRQERVSALEQVQDERMPGSLQSVLEEAAASGVQQLACNGCWQEDWGRVAAAARSHPLAVVANFGLHPWWVPQRSHDWLQQLRRMLVEHPQACLGEVRQPASASGPACRLARLHS